MGLLTQEISEFVNQTKLGFAATICPDGTPNLSPKGTTIAWDEDHLAFADIYSPGTVTNILNNPAIEINVVDVFARKGFRFKGIAHVLQKGAIYESIIQHYRNTESEYRINNIVLVHVNRALPLFSPVYDHLAETEIINRWIDYWNSVYSLKK